MVFYELFKGTKHENTYIAVRRAVKVGALATVASLVAYFSGVQDPSTWTIGLTAALAAVEKYLSEQRDGGQAKPT